MTTPTRIWSTNDYDAAVKTMSAQLKSDSDAIRITIEASKLFVKDKKPEFRITVSCVVDGEIKKSVSGLGREGVIESMFFGSVVAPNYGEKIEIQIYKPEVMELKKVKEDYDAIKHKEPKVKYNEIRERILPKIEVLRIDQSGKEDKINLVAPPRIAEIGKRRNLTV